MAMVRCTSFHVPSCRSYLCLDREYDSALFEDAIPINDCAWFVL